MAAVTSAIALIEPGVEWLEDKGLGRVMGAMKPETLRDDSGLGDGWLFRRFQFVLRFLSPAAVLVVFVYNLAWALRAGALLRGI